MEGSVKADDISVEARFQASAAEVYLRSQPYITVRQLPLLRSQVHLFNRSLTLWPLGSDMSGRLLQTVSKENNASVFRVEVFMR
jgi:hypothetical protein